MASARSFILEVFREWRKDEATRHSAAIAYYTVFALPALLLVILSIAGSLARDIAVTDELRFSLTGMIGPETADFILNSMVTLQSTQSWGTIAGIIGTLALIGAAIGIIREIQRTLNIMLNLHRPKRGIIRTILGYVIPLILLVLTSAVLAASVLTGSIITALGDRLADMTGIGIDTFAVLHGVITYAVVTVLFFLLYVFLPAKRFPLLIILLCSVIASAALVSGTVVMSYYIALAGLGKAYGVAASLLVVLFWTYFAANVFLLGAEMIDVTARMHGLSPAKKRRWHPMGIVKKARK